VWFGHRLTSYFDADGYRPLRTVSADAISAAIPHTVMDGKERGG
jgi:hypothetical protein